MFNNFRSNRIHMPNCHTCQTPWQSVCLYNIVIFFEKFKKSGNFFSFFFISSNFSYLYTPFFITWHNSSSEPAQQEMPQLTM